jgi:hypothetical protein
MKSKTMFIASLVFAVALGSMFFIQNASADIAPLPDPVYITAGDLIKGSQPAVYYYAADAKRYAYPTQSTFFSWRKDFSKVKTIKDTELAAIDLVGNVTVRPGTKLIKIQSVNKVYAVSRNSRIRHLKDETAAQKLYGVNWATRVIDIPDSFWMNYVDINLPLDGSEYPEGSVVQPYGSSDTYYVNSDKTWSKFSSREVFYENNLYEPNIINVPADYEFVRGADITGKVYYIAEDVDAAVDIAY